MCVCVWGQTERLALTHTHTHTPTGAHSCSLFLPCAQRGVGGRENREGKNEEDVRRAARLDSATAGLLMKHRSGHPIIQVPLLALHGNEK